MKILSQEEYDKFASDLKEAQMSLINKEEKVAEVYNQIEQGLILLGATIVEDKLQDLVPETIRDLRLAKVKVWMLTGDKMNTAYNIGLSCNLISKKMKTFNVKGLEKKVNHELVVLNKEERNKVIIDFAKEYQGFKNNFDSMTKPSFGILVDEKALLTISEDEEIHIQRFGVARCVHSGQRSNCWPQHRLLQRRGVHLHPQGVLLAGEGHMGECRHLAACQRHQRERRQ